MLRLPGGHHFEGSHGHVARLICDAVDRHVLKRR
jgi:type IV secretory pathway VirJ component